MNATDLQKEVNIVGKESQKINMKKDATMISITSLSDYTGFPIEYIKKELMTDKESLSIDDLRKMALLYLHELF